MKTFKGIVKARIVTVRFASSGKILGVNKYTGDEVKRGEIIAYLDTKILQTQLDKQLADYEKTRADFEIFTQKYPDPQDAIDKYLKTEKQATLNASVKDVELAKLSLDLCSLVSPVDGAIIDDSSIVPGLNVTPTGSEIKIIDASSYYVEIEINQKDVGYFEKSKEARIKIEGMKEELKGSTSSVYSDGKKLFIKIPVSNKNLLLGTNGKIKI